MFDSIGSKLAVIFVVGFVVVLIGVSIGTDIFATQNKDKSLNLYSIGDLMADPQKFIGMNITVPGYYFHGDLPDGEGYITSEQVQQPIIEGSFDNVDFMIINISGININLNESTLYDFTGALISQEHTTYSGISVILSVEEVELV